MRHKLLFVVLLLLLGPICLQASQETRADSPRRILIIKSRDISFYDATLQGFIQGLSARGYSSSQSVSLKVIALTGDPDTDGRVVKEELSKNNALIFTLGTDATIAVQGQQVSTPCLFTMVLDPVYLKLAKSLSKPNGEFTGTTLLVDPGKQLEALQEVASRVKTVGLLYTDGDASSIAFLASASQEAQGMNMQLDAVPISNYVVQGRKALEELAPKVDAFWLIVDPSSAGQQALSDTFAVAKEHNLPVLGVSSPNVRAGALIALSANLKDLGDVDAEMACSLLDGTQSCANMTIRGPRQTILSINLNTAKSLGITIPDSVLHLADEVIDAGPTSQN